MRLLYTQENNVQIFGDTFLKKTVALTSEWMIIRTLYYISLCVICFDIDLFTRRFFNINKVNEIIAFCHKLRQLLSIREAFIFNRSG